MNRISWRYFIALVAGMAVAVQFLSLSPAIGDEPASLNVVEFCYPTPEMPYYHVRCSLSSEADEPLDIKTISAVAVGQEGEPAQFRTIVGGQRMESGYVPPKSEATLLIRCDWQPAAEYQVNLDYERTVEGEDNSSASLVASGVSPEEGGYWDTAWATYAPIVVKERHGLARELEPVDVSIALLAEDVTDIARELRLVEIDPETGSHTLIPSQPYAVSAYSKGPPWGPSVRFSVAFLATLPPRGSKVYLAFYGNPNASAPAYETDLTVTGEGVGFTWENSQVRYGFSEDSGQLNEILIKMGLDKTLAYSPVIHWNPGCYSPPRAWAHTYSWKYPDTISLSEIRGPVFVQSSRWGIQQPHMPELFCSVTYRLYAYNPQLYMSSVQEVVDDIAVTWMRNDEMVLPGDAVTHAAWQDLNGEVKAGPLNPSSPGERPFWNGLKDLDIPWICLYHPDEGYGYGSIRLQHAYSQKYGKPATSHLAGTYITGSSDHIWYWYRAYIRDELMLPLERGTAYAETNAYLPFRLGEGNAALDPIIQATIRLTDPLEARSE